MQRMDVFLFVGVLNFDSSKRLNRNLGAGIYLGVDELLVGNF